MSESTDKLIELMVQQLRPVKRLRPPILRAAFWLGIVILLAVSAIYEFAPARHRPLYTVTDVAFWSMLATAVFGIVSAFHLSVPGYSRAWVWLPLPPMLFWIASSGHSCYRAWLNGGTGMQLLAESPHCFLFIVLTSAPLAMLLLWMLRKARPLDPLPVALVGGAGVAASAAFLLQYFHPFDVTISDLLVHLGAVGLVVATTATLGKKTLA